VDGATGALSFPSAMHTPYRENNTVHALYFRAGADPALRTRAVSPRRAVLVLPQWNAGADGHIGLCRLLNRFGMSALRLSLPYHHARRPAELTRADYIVSANIGRTVQACRQAVMDARRAIAWLAGQGYERIGILGTSLGSCLSLLTAAHEPLVQAQALNHISPYFADVVWRGLSTSHVRESLEGAIDLERLRALWLPISPQVYLDRVRGKKTLTDLRQVRSDVPGRSLAQSGGRVRAPRHYSRSGRAAVRPLLHRPHAIQISGRVLVGAISRQESVDRGKNGSVFPTDSPAGSGMPGR
jgi:hypothetical protein